MWYNSNLYERVTLIEIYVYIIPEKKVKENNVKLGTKN